MLFGGTVTLRVVSDEQETWVSAIKGRKKLRLLENWVLTKVFGRKGEKATGNCVMSFMICAPCKMLSG